MVCTNFAIKVYNINLVSFGLESGRYDITDEMNSGSKLPIRLCPKSAKIKKDRRPMSMLTYNKHKYNYKIDVHFIRK